jgi:DNA replication and repair protein RecF
LAQGAGTEDEFSALNQLLAESGTKIMQARQSVVDELRPLALSRYEELRYNEGTFEIVYRPCLPINELSAESLYVFLHAKLPMERERRGVLAGPQREELQITLGGQSAQQYASQGQTRSIVLALKMGLIDVITRTRGESPVVLLDDVESELDEYRCRALSAHLREERLQVFLTGTTASGFSWGQAGEEKFFKVDEGRISEGN